MLVSNLLKKEKKCFLRVEGTMLIATICRGSSLYPFDLSGFPVSILELAELFRTWRLDVLSGSDPAEGRTCQHLVKVGVTCSADFLVMRRGGFGSIVVV